MPSPIGRRLAGVALVSAALLMTELALTRIFSVVMYYHFAFLAISIALFGVSASGVFAYLARRRLDRFDTDTMLAAESIVYAVATIVALFWLVRLRVGLNYSPHNLALIAPRRADARAIAERAGTRRARAILAVAAAPSLATLVYEWATRHAPSNAIRFAAGLPIGIAVAWLLVAASEDQVN